MNNITEPNRRTVREQYEAPRSWTQRAYPKLIYYKKVDRSGRFAAWEEPEIFSAEIRAAFLPLRSSYLSSQGDTLKEVEP